MGENKLDEFKVSWNDNLYKLVHTKCYINKLP